jgi:uncharacterized phiE125 gp8 family phage protein
MSEPLGVTSALVTAPTLEPIDTATAKLYARLSGSDLDALIPGFIKNARWKVEQDTGLALLTQTHDVFLEAFPASCLEPSRPIALPWRPVQSVTSIVSIDTAGNSNTLAPTNYVLDPGSESPAPARIALAAGGAWPTDLRPFRPGTIRIVVGWTAAALLPPPIVHAVGLLSGYYINEGSGRYVEATLLDQYEETIAKFCLVSVG